MAIPLIHKITFLRTFMIVKINLLSSKINKSIRGLMTKLKMTRVESLKDVT